MDAFCHLYARDPETGDTYMILLKQSTFTSRRAVGAVSHIHRWLQEGIIDERIAGGLENGVMEFWQLVNSERKSIRG